VLKWVIQALTWMKMEKKLKDFFSFLITYQAIGQFLMILKVKVMRE